MAEPLVLEALSQYNVAAIMLAEIAVDVANGRVPAEVTTFSALHDYVDANMYGDAEKLLEMHGMEFVTHLLNGAQNIVDMLLRQGVLLRFRPAPVAAALTQLDEIEGEIYHDDEAGWMFCWEDVDDDRMPHEHESDVNDFADDIDESKLSKEGLTSCVATFNNKHHSHPGYITVIRILREEA